MPEESRERAEAETPRFYCGVDLGASATKLVLLDADGRLRAKAVRPSGVDYAGTARACLAEALAEVEAKPTELFGTVATGYGRHNVGFADSTRTEIHCHAVGCHHLVPRAITIVDIGGQDNKVIHLDEAGRRTRFRMNRKCAAGTGAFIEEIALRLGLQVQDLEALARDATEAVQLGSFCTVFTKTEILAYLRQGMPVEGIVRGAFESVVKRILEMDSLDGDVVATGGVVAHNPTIVAILAEKLERDVTVPPEPQFTGALGAALSVMSQSREH